jgi:PAS domain S-box-containing protein
MKAEGGERIAVVVALDCVGVPLWAIDVARVRAALRATGDDPFDPAGLCSGTAIVMANRAALDFFGAASVSQLRHQLGRVLPPDARLELARLLGAVGDAEPQVAGEIEVATLAGDSRTVAVMCRADMESRDPPLAVLTFVDVSEARRAEQELRELETRHRALLDGIPDLVVEVGPDGVYRGHAGPRDAWSTPPAAFLGRRAGEVTVPELARPALDAIEQVRATGKTATVEYSLPIAGEMRGLEVRVAPAPRLPRIVGPDGLPAGPPPAPGPGGVIVVVRDATERWLTEKRLQESELRFRTMADGAPVLLWMAGTDGLCNFFNRGWLEFRGRTQEEECGTGWAAGVHPEDFQGCLLTFMEAFAARRPFRMEYRLRRFDGEYRWILDEGAPRYAPDGSFAGFIGSCIDITELRELQTRLDLRVRERTAELAASVQELEAFCYSVSHDLRAPLRAIDGFCHALLDDYGTIIDERGHDYLRRARAAANRMGELIDGLLKLSRIGRAALREIDIDLSRTAREVAADLEKAYPERRVRFAIQDGLIARGDPLLATVLENLLDNAVKFTTRSAEPVIEFGANRIDGQLVYYVRDNGVGFNMDYSKRLFGTFQRLHSPSDFPGTGVGLASVQRVIHRHGGRVWAEASEGRGATFFFSLPEPPGP